MNHSINILLWITLFALLYINVKGLCGAPGEPDICSGCGSQTICLSVTYGCGCFWNVNVCQETNCTTSSPSKPPSKSPSIFTTKPPSKSPSKSPSTLQFTEIRTIVLSGNYTDFERYAVDNNITLNQAGLEIIQTTLLQTSGDPDALANLIITVINTFKSSIGIEFSITSDQSTIDAADNTFQDAIDNTIEITVGTLSLTPLSVTSETLTTITPSKSPNYDSDSSSSEGSDSSDIHAANQISDFSDQNNIKGNSETDLTIFISNKTFTFAWCILIGMLIITVLYAYCEYYKNY